MRTGASHARPPTEGLAVPRPLLPVMLAAGVRDGELHGLLDDRVKDFVKQRIDDGFERLHGFRGGRHQHTSTRPSHSKARQTARCCGSSSLNSNHASGG